MEAHRLRCLRPCLQYNGDKDTNKETIDLPEGSTTTKMSSPLPSIQRRPTLKWVCHSTLLYIPH